MRTQLILSVALICGVLRMSSAQSSCQKCNSNDAYCVDEKSYYVCFDDQNPWTAELHYCAEGEVCTATDNICEPIKGPNNVENTPICSGACGKCPATTATYSRYTCASKTQFGRCVSDKVTVIGTCEAGHICSSELYAQTGVICAPQCVTDFYKVSATCENDVITTTTTTTTTTVPPVVDVANLKAQCKAAADNHPTAKYFYIRNANDDECKTYIFCERFGDDMDVLLATCKTGYFDSAQSKCVAEMPAECEEDLGSGGGFF